MSEWKFVVEISVQLFLGLAGFAIAGASVWVAKKTADVAAASDKRQRESAERAARHEAARGLMRYLENDEVDAVVRSRFEMARAGIDDFTDVTAWAMDAVNAVPEELRGFIRVLVQNRLMEWVSTGKLDDSDLLTSIDSIRSAMDQLPAPLNRPSQGGIVPPLGQRRSMGSRSPFHNCNVLVGIPLVLRGHGLAMAG